MKKKHIMEIVAYTTVGDISTKLESTLQIKGNVMNAKSHVLTSNA